MKQSLDSIRLILEIVLLAAFIELSLMVAMPIVLPSVTGWVSAIIDAMALAMFLSVGIWWRWHSAKARARMVSARKPSQTVANLVLSLGMFLFGIVITVLVSHQAHRESAARIDEKFERLTARLKQDMNRRMALPLFGLQGVVGVHLASDVLTADEFRSYVASIDMPHQFRGVRAFGYIVPVNRSQLHAYEIRQKRLVSPDFRVKTSGESQQMYIVQTIEPMAANKPALGFDMGSEPIRLTGIHRAIQTGMPTLSGKISLLQDADRRAGVLYMIPVYKKTTDKHGQARELEGIYYTPLVIDELMADLPQEGDGQIDMDIRDITLSDEWVTSLYEWRGLPGDDSQVLPLAKLHEIEVAGRKWQVRMTPNRRFLEGLNQHVPLWLAVGGSVISLVLAWATWTLVSSRNRAEQIALRMTQDLNTLAQVVKLTSNAVIISNANHEITWVNEGFTRLYGYTAEEAHGKLLRDLVFSPNTPEENSHYLYRCIEQGMACHTEVLNRSKDGNEFWVETEVQPQRNDDGKIVGYIKINQNVSELKEAKRRLEDALRETETLLKTLHGHALVSVTDRNGVIIEANEGFCRISGYSREELIGKTHAIINSDYHGKEFWRNMWRTIAGGNSWKSEVCNRSKDGQCYWVDSMITPIINAEGKIEKYVSIRYDVTSRKLSEHQLQSNRAFLDRVSRTAKVGGWQLNLLTQQIEWTGLSHCIPGVDPDLEIDLDQAMHMLQSKGKLQLQLAMRQAVEMRTPWDIEVEATTPAGKRIWLRSVGEAEFEGGTAVRLVGSFQDVTDRREAQMQLNETSNLLRNVLDSASGVAVVAVAPTGVIKLFNPGAEKLLGFASSEIVGIHTPTLFVKDNPSMLLSLPAARAALSCILPVEDVLGVVTNRIYTRKGGELVHVSQVVTEIRNNDGELSGYLLLAQDMTERLRYEASLQEAKSLAENASAAKGQFLANMSHEIRTPMNAVLGLLRLLGRTSLSDKQKSYVDKTESAARSLLGLLNDVLDYSKIEAGKMELDVNPFRVDRLMSDLSVVLESCIGDKPVQLVLRVDPMIPNMLIGDDIRLQQVLMNLGSNAVKFTSHGEVVVRLLLLARHEDKVKVQFSVEDSGIGIAPEAQKKIFEGFMQAEYSTTRRFGGTGLGLTISKSLVDIMGGALQISSQLGQGSKFWFNLELGVDESQQAVSASAMTLSMDGRAPSGNDRLMGVRLLLVEDNATNRQVAGELLRDEGATVDEAINGMEGVQKVLANPGAYDVILMDIQMPVMDGLTAARQLNEMLGERMPPIIAMTANVSTADLHEAQEAGMGRHVGKPFDLDELVYVITLAHHQSMVALPQRIPTVLPDLLDGADDINVPQALARFGGRQRVYVQLLESFLREVDGAEVRLEQWASENDIHSLRRWLHTVRGLSGTMGHDSLSRTVLQAEKQLKECPDACTEWIPVVSLALADARLVVQDLIARMKPSQQMVPEHTAEQFKAAQFHEDCQALLRLLDRGDMQALDVHAEFSRKYSPWLADKLEQLGNAIGGLDFAEAVRQCQSLLVVVSEE